MKKVFKIVLSLMMGLSLAACSSKTEEAKDLLDEIKERGTLVIATEGDWAPWTYHDEANNLVGFDVEVGTRIAEILGVKAEFQETTWDSILEGVQAGRFDIACNGVGYSEERAESFNFTEPYCYTNTCLIVLEDSPIKTFDDLKGMRTGNTISSTYALIAEGYGATVTGVDDFVQTIELLKRGDIDATINAQVSFFDYMAQHPEEKIKVAAIDEANGEIMVIPAKKDDSTKTLIEAINAALQQLRDSGELAELSNKYFGGDITVNQ